MNGKDLFWGLTYVGSDLIEEAEREQLSSKNVKSGGKYATERQRKRPLLIAALIALLLLLTGCAALAVYLRMEHLKLGIYSLPTATVQEAEDAPSTAPLELDVFSLQGVTDSPQYLAGKEWFDFTQSYEYQPQVGWDSPPDYWAYCVLDQTMVDKLDEICAKYGLTIIGRPRHEDGDFSNLLKLAGIETLLKADCDA